MELRRKLALITLTFAVAGLGAPVAAQAETFCVTPASSPGCTPEGTIQSALDDAVLSPERDRVELGAATYATPTSAGFVYAPQNNIDPVDIVGAGSGQSVIAVPAPLVEPVSETSFTGLTLSASNLTAGSTVSGLTVSLPTPTFTSTVPTGSNQTYIGIQDGTGDSQFDDVTVSSPASVPIRATGINSALGGTRFADGTISLGPGDANNPNYGIQESALNSLDAAVTHSTVTSDLPLRYDNPGTGVLKVNRSRLNPRSTGVEVATSNVDIRNSIIDLGANAGAHGLDVGYENPNGITSSSAVLDGVTIAGSGDDQRGVEVHANADNNVPGTDTATATIANTVIDLRGTGTNPIYRTDDVDGTATVSYDYTALDQATIFSQSGGGAITPGGVNAGTHNPAGAVPAAVIDFAGGNYHPAPGTALVDTGDPAAPPPGTLDFDGNLRVRDGNADCVDRRDIGAYELVPGAVDCFPPDTTVTGGPSGPTKDTTPTFTFSATEAATFQCRFDAQPFAACSGPGASHTPSALTEGAHTFSVRATDNTPALNVDPTPATRSFTVDTVAPQTGASVTPKVKTKKKSARVSFSLTSNEGGSSFQCSLDGAGFSKCSSPLAAVLKKGSHTLLVKATDAAGNVDATPASATVRVVKKKRKKR